MDAKQLQKLVKDAQKVLIQRERSVARKLHKEMQDIAARLEVGVDELLGFNGKDKGKPAKKKGKTGKVAPKYRNPKNHNETWTGRGRKPKWVENFIEYGGKMEDITIK